MNQPAGPGHWPLTNLAGSGQDLLPMHCVRTLGMFSDEFSRDLSNKLKDFLLCIGVRCKKNGAKVPKFKANAHFSGVLQDF